MQRCCILSGTKAFAWSKICFKKKREKEKERGKRIIIKKRSDTWTVYCAPLLPPIPRQPNTIMNKWEGILYMHIVHATKSHKKRERETGRQTENETERAYNADEDEENNEYSSKNSGGIDVSKAHSWHGDHQKIQTFPVGQFLRVGKVEEWIPWVLNLQAKTKVVTEHLIFFLRFTWTVQKLWQSIITGS